MLGIHLGPRPHLAGWGFPLREAVPVTVFTSSGHLETRDQPGFVRKCVHCPRKIGWTERNRTWRNLPTRDPREGIDENKQGA